MEFSTYKIYLCKKYIDDNKCKYSKEKCKYAHGEDDIYCKFKENCNNRDCNRIHLINDQKYIKYNLEEKEKHIYNDNHYIINELRKEINERLNKLELEIINLKTNKN